MNNHQALLTLSIIKGYIIAGRQDLALEYIDEESLKLEQKIAPENM